MAIWLLWACCRNLNCNACLTIKSDNIDNPQSNVFRDRFIWILLATWIGNIYWCMDYMLRLCHRALKIRILGVIPKLLTTLILYKYASLDPLPSSQVIMMSICQVHRSCSWVNSPILSMPLMVCFSIFWVFIISYLTCRNQEVWLCYLVNILRLSPNARRADNFNNYLTDGNDIIFISLQMGTGHIIPDNMLILQL